MIPLNKMISSRTQSTTCTFLNMLFSGGHFAGTVILSESKDIYRNLALEDWLYKNLCFKDISPGILLMWRNKPAVVIGRHQNPWVEYNQKIAKAKGIDLARRNSGGGTVYHDDGNLNCSFITSRSNYNRKDNLKVICAALQKKWNFDVTISDREDIILQNSFKISGTASKLGSKNAYHHCTVLISAECETLSEVLHKNRDGIINKATESVKSKTKILRELCANLTVEDVSSEITQQYHEFHKVERRRIISVYPNEEKFPGINNSIEHLRSWEWIYGWTPRFTVSRTFSIDGDSKFLYSDTSDSCCSTTMEVEIGVYHGCIENIKFTPHFSNEEAYSALQNSLCGIRFIPENIISAISMWNVKYSEYKAAGKFILKTAEKAMM